MARPRTVKLILPALTEASSPFWRPIKYSLFPPLGLATLAAHLDPDAEATLVDEHVEPLALDDRPDLVVIQVYITNAYRAYRIADHYRRRGSYVAIGGLHPTALPEEAAAHADSVFCGPGDATFPTFLADLAAGVPRPLYLDRGGRSLEHQPPLRRDLIRRALYLVPNSLVVSRGCPHHCTFCYKDAFFAGGRSFYTQRVDAALAEIERLPGRHLYFLDDHLFGDRRFADALFAGMEGMGRLFQGASTVDAVLRGDTVERAVRAGLRSLFVGFETLSPDGLAATNKRQNLGRDYRAAIRRLDELGVKVNASFVFGLDGDGPDVFARTVDWAIESGVTTATFHIATPYPGTAFHRQIADEGRITSHDWGRYDTRHAVFVPRGMTTAQLERGYWWSYDAFYRWSSLWRASQHHVGLRQGLTSLAYGVAWKKLEPIWDLAIRLRRLTAARPLVEVGLASTGRVARQAASEVVDPELDARPRPTTA